MLARLAHLVLAVSLLAPITAADARGYAKAPPASAPVPAEVVDLAPPSAGAVRAALTARRAHNLQAFRAYRTAGIYPHNTVRPGPLNVWRDPDGHLCAAATMLDKDGQHDLVMATAKDDNQIRLLDVTTGPLMDWILTSGLTLEEIDRIQAPPAMPMPSPEPVRPYAAEDDRLRKDYAATDAWLGKHANDGLTAATERLMLNPTLAWKLVSSLE